jgi:hypothetical protein
MTSNSTKLPVLDSDAEIGVGLLDEWFDPIEAGLRDRVRELIQTMIESELEAVLSRPRYARRPKADPEQNGACGVAGHRHGHRSHQSHRSTSLSRTTSQSLSPMGGLSSSDWRQPPVVTVRWSSHPTSHTRVAKSS